MPNQSRRFRGLTRLEWVVVGLILLVVTALLIPSQGYPIDVANRNRCRNNLKQIAVALYAYHEAYGSFPPAVVRDARGNPLHSWRVLILPFLDQAALYDRYRFDEPWDGPNNRRLAAQMPEVYQCPTDKRRLGERARERTPYLAMAGPSTIFDGTRSTSIREISDGASNTLLVAEAPGELVNWMEPRDVRVEGFLHALNDEEAVERRHSVGTHILFGDGRVSFLSSTTSPETVRALATIEGGEDAGEY